MSISGLVIGTYLAVLIVLAVYGLHRTALDLDVLPEQAPAAAPRGPVPELPVVTVQLPLFNEMYVAAAPARCGRRHRLPARPLRDPGARRLDRRDAGDLQAQDRRAARATGLDIMYIHRTDRTGYKAGALETGLKTAQGRARRGLRRRLRAAAGLPPATRPPLHRPEGRHGAGALGATSTATTRCSPRSQALMLDGHFVIEHTAPQPLGPLLQLLRHRRHVAPRGHRRRGRLAARHAHRGHRPLVPRAAASGWKFVYLPDVVAPAELPVEMNAVQVAAVPLGQGLGAGGEEAARRRSCART